jgi:hypothetical protein
LRAAPHANAAEVGRLRYDDAVQILSEDNGDVVDDSPIWYRVQDLRSGQTGFVHSSVFAETATPGRP